MPTQWRHIKHSKFHFNKSDFIRYLMQENVNLTYSEVDHFVKSFLEALEFALLNGKRIPFINFGTFYLKYHKRRRIKSGFDHGSNTSEYPEGMMIKFKASPTLLEKIKSKKDFLLKKHQEYADYINKNGKGKYKRYVQSSN